MKKAISILLVLCLMILGLPLSTGIAWTWPPAPTVTVDPVAAYSDYASFHVSFPKPDEWEGDLRIFSVALKTEHEPVSISSFARVTPDMIHGDTISADLQTKANGEDGFVPGVYTMKVDYEYKANGVYTISKEAEVIFGVSSGAPTGPGNDEPEEPEAPNVSVYAVSSGAESIRFSIDFTLPENCGRCLFYGYHVYDSAGNPATFSESMRIPMTAVQDNKVSIIGSADSLNDDGFSAGTYTLQVRYFYLHDDDYIYSKVAEVAFTVSDDEARDNNPVAPTVTMDPVSEGDEFVNYTVSFPKPKEWDDVIQIEENLIQSDGTIYGYQETFMIRHDMIQGDTVSLSTDAQPFTPFGPGDYVLQIGYFYTVSGENVKSPKTSIDFTVADSVENAFDIGEAKIKVADQVYTGKSVKPKITVTYDGQKLFEGKDYSVSFKKNKAIGKATVKIKGFGKYTGTNTATFKILPKAVALSSLKAGKKSLTVRWKKGSDITGYEIQYGRKEDFSDAKTITVSGAGQTDTEITGLKKGKTYYVRVRAFKKVDGKKYKSAWSKVKQKKVK